MDFLKGILGDGYEDFEGKVNAYNSAEENKDKQIKLANINSGDYISKEKYTSLETEAEGYKTQLGEANKQIASFKDMDVEGIKAKAGEWETKYKEDTEKLQTQLKDQKYGYEAEKYLGKFNFASTLAKEAALSKFKEQGFELSDDGFKGADEYMKQLKESDPTAFVTEQKEEPKPKKWVKGTGGTYKPPTLDDEEAYLKAKYGKNKYYNG